MGSHKLSTKYSEKFTEVWLKAKHNMRKYERVLEALPSTIDEIKNETTASELVETIKYYLKKKRELEKILKKIHKVSVDVLPLLQLDNMESPEFKKQLNKIKDWEINQYNTKEIKLTKKHNKKIRKENIKLKAMGHATKKEKEAKIKELTGEIRIDTKPALKPKENNFTNRDFPKQREESIRTPQPKNNIYNFERKDERKSNNDRIKPNIK